MARQADVDRMTTALHAVDEALAALAAVRAGPAFHTVVAARIRELELARRRLLELRERIRVEVAL